MSKAYLIGAAALAAATALSAQAPVGTAEPQAGREPATAQKPATITLIGCLVREQDVPGRKPDVAERVGILEDYILTGAVPADRASRPNESGAVGTSGAPTSRHISTMYKVEGIADSELKRHVGKRVEVTGRVDRDDERETALAQKATTPGSHEDMPEFEATGIREIAGECSSRR
jgi:hypothetical protein